MSEQRITINRYPSLLRKYYDSNIMRGIKNYRTNKLLKQDRDNFYKLFQRETPLFNSIYFETTSYCNNDCPYCPVNARCNPKPKEKMPLEIIEKVLSELKEVGFGGRVGIYNNNEPLLDKRIVSIISLTRDYLPTAHIFIYTNGILLNRNLFLEMERAGLNSIIINNYEDNYRLIKPVRKFITEMQEYPVNIKCKVSVQMRKKNVVLNNRAGRAPNKNEQILSPYSFCHLPFQQFVVNYLGDVSICCNDALSECVLGSVKRDSIIDIWTGERYNRIRSALLDLKRGSIPICSRCDTPGYSAFRYIIDDSMGMPKLKTKDPHKLGLAYLGKD